MGRSVITRAAPADTAPQAQAQAAQAVRRPPVLPDAPRLGVWPTLRQHPAALAGAAILAAVALVGLFAPLLFPGDPLAITGAPFLWPGADAAHPLGTDSLGRDILAGLAYGARISLRIGLCAAALGLVVGVTIGALAGYRGGWTDAVLSRLIEIFQTLPAFVLLVVLVAVMSPTPNTLSAAIAAVTWPTVARLARTEFRSLREKDFVLAARSMGYGHTRIIIHEILPNALPPIVVTASVMVASAILMEAALSFMGLGDPNVVSWGSMIGAGREYLRSGWYMSALPGFAIMLTVVALNLIGDALNEAMNPRRRRRP